MYTSKRNDKERAARHAANYEAGERIEALYGDLAEVLATTPALDAEARRNIIGDIEARRRAWIRIFRGSETPDAKAAAARNFLSGKLRGVSLQRSFLEGIAAGVPEAAPVTDRIKAETAALAGANADLAQWVALKYGKKLPLGKEDMLSECYAGLMWAATRYVPQPGASFAGYAVESMWGFAKSAVRKNAKGLVGFTTEARQAADAILKARATLRLAGNHDPSQKEVYEESGLGDPRRMAQGEAVLIGESVLSLDASMADWIADGDDDLTLHDVISDPDAPTPEDAAGSVSSTELVRKLLPDLPARQVEVLRRKFGIEAETSTVTAMAKEFGVSHQRVKQIELQALNNLKKALRRNYDIRSAAEA